MKRLSDTISAWDFREWRIIKPMPEDTFLITAIVSAYYTQIDTAKLEGIVIHSQPNRVSAIMSDNKDWMSSIDLVRTGEYADVEVIQSDVPRFYNECSDITCCITTPPTEPLGVVGIWYNFTEYESLSENIKPHFKWLEPYFRKWEKGIIRLKDKKRNTQSN